MNEEMIGEIFSATALFLLKAAPSWLGRTFTTCDFDREFENPAAVTLCRTFLAVLQLVFLEGRNVNSSKICSAATNNNEIA